MIIKHLKSQDYQKMPWKNGRGTTTQMAIYPLDSTFPGDSFLWRVSSAPIVESGPFSTFPGYDRILMICEGEGVILNGKKLAKEQPLHFFGDISMYCELVSGMVQDLGVIYRRDKTQAHLEFEIASQWPNETIKKIIDSDFHLFICLRGEFKITCDTAFHIATMECLLIEDPVKKTQVYLLALTSDCALVSISFKNI